MSALFILALAMVPVSMPREDDYITPSGTATPVRVDLYRGVVATQQFPASGKVISGVSLLLTTYARANAPGYDTVNVELATQVDGKWKVVRSRSVKRARLRDEAFSRFSFSRPLKVKPGTLMALTVKSDVQRAHRIGWLVNPQWEGEHFLLSVGEAKRAGVAQFSVHYQRAAGSLATMAPRLWKRVTIFLHLFGKVLLVCGFFLALIGMTHALLWPPVEDESEADNKG